MTPAETAHGTEVGIDRIGQRFGANRVLDGIDLTVAAGEVVALLGPSGCGKTTLLRLIAGLATPTEGRIRLGETVVADAGSGRFLPPERRSLGMVFQDYALWPHMSVAGNVAFPLEMRNVPRAERRARVLEALRLVGLEALADRQPGTLSGGQQQRVALARAIVSRPSVILFDEPLSNLDRELRESLVVDIAALVRRLGLTAIYVTHDHGEAFAMADRVAVLQGGSLLQVAPPEELVGRPAGVAVAEFLKLGLVLGGEARDGALLLGDGALRVEPPASFLNGHRHGHLFVPRGALRPAEPERAALTGTALHSQFRGDGYAVHLRLTPHHQMEIACDRRLAEGQPLGIEIAWDRARWFPAPLPAE